MTKGSNRYCSPSVPKSVGSAVSPKDHCRPMSAAALRRLARGWLEGDEKTKQIPIKYRKAIAEVCAEVMAAAPVSLASRMTKKGSKIQLRICDVLITLLDGRPISFTDEYGTWPSGKARPSNARRDYLQDKLKKAIKQENVIRSVKDVMDFNRDPTWGLVPIRLRWRAGEICAQAIMEFQSARFDAIFDELESRLDQRRMGPCATGLPDTLARYFWAHKDTGNHGGAEGRIKLLKLYPLLVGAVCLQPLYEIHSEEGGRIAAWPCADPLGEMERYLSTLYQIPPSVVRRFRRKREADFPDLNFRKWPPTATHSKPIENKAMYPLATSALGHRSKAEVELAHEVFEVLSAATLLVPPEGEDGIHDIGSMFSDIPASRCITHALFTLPDTVRWLRENAPDQIGIVYKMTFAQIVNMSNIAHERFDDISRRQQLERDEVAGELRQLGLIDHKQAVAVAEGGYAEGDWSPAMRVCIVHDGLHTTELLTGKDLECESDRLQHCVRQYTEQCKKGGSRILSVRNDNDESLSTVELCISSGEVMIRQHLARRNGEPGEREKAVVAILRDYLDADAKLSKSDPTRVTSMDWRKTIRPKIKAPPHIEKKRREIRARYRAERRQMFVELLSRYSQHQ